RVDRALEKLRKFLTRRGVTLSAAALATVLNGEAVVTAPVGLAASVTGAALAGAAGGTGTTLTLLKLMAMTKLKAGVVSAVVVAALATLTVVQHRTLTKLRDENAALRERTKQLDQLRAENQQWMKLKVDADELQRLRAEHAELMRLRGQVGLLGRQAQQA